MSKRNIFKFVSLVGMVLGGIGTLITELANDKEIDAIIDEKLDERIAAHDNEEEESEES